ncbi:MAG: MarR family transcriptional regulator [Gaiellales bacterium]|nr:MarR family transcriptional regulator [Gaiellales bacterium]
MAEMEVPGYQAEDPSDSEDIVGQACRAYVELTRAGSDVQARVNEDLVAVGLTFSQFAALEVLYNRGPSCQRDIAQRILAHSSGNMTLVIDHLEQRGLVERIPGRVDRRMIEVRLTLTGEALISNFLPRHMNHIAEELCALTLDEIQTLSELCRKLRRGRPGDM